MIDINNRSIELAIKNALQNNVNVNVFNSNIYENVTKKYNFIITLMLKIILRMVDKFGLLLTRTKELNLYLKI